MTATNPAGTSIDDNVIDTWAQGLHYRRELVSLHHRVTRVRVLAVEHMNVRAAYTDPMDPQ